MPVLPVDIAPDVQGMVDSLSVSVKDIFVQLAPLFILPIGVFIAFLIIQETIGFVASLIWGTAEKMERTIWAPTTPAYPYDYRGHAIEEVDDDWDDVFDDDDDDD